VTDGPNPAPRLSPVHRILIAALVMDLAVAMMGMGVQFLGNHLQARPSVLGWLGTISPLAYTLLCLVTGRLSDHLGRRLLVSVGCLVCAIAWLSMTQASSPLQLLAILPFSGSAIAMFWPPLQAWLSEVTVGGRERLVQNIGGFNIAWTVGLMCGPVLAGVAWHLGTGAPFTIAAALVLGLLVLLQTIPDEVEGGGEEAPEERDHKRPDGDVARRFLHLAWIANFASWFGRGLNIVVFTKLGTEMGLHQSTIGATVATFLAGQLAMFAYLRNRSGWQYRLWPLMVALGAGGGAWLLAYFARSPWSFAAAFALGGMGAGVTYVSSLYYSLEGQAVSRGARTGIHEAVLGSGVFLGPLSGGFVADVLGLREPYIMAALVFAAVAAAVYLAWRQMRGSIARRAARNHLEVTGQ